MLNPEIIINPSYTTDLRRKLRQNSTEAERLLWQRLRGKKLGVKFYRQFGLRCYIVDFCCRAKRLIIELDGEIHENNKTKECGQYKTEELESLGFTVLRFKNNEVFKNIEEILASIKNTLFQLSPLLGGEVG